jgi:hypothetical protein
MWPSQLVGKVFMKTICYLFCTRNENGLHFTRGFDHRSREGLTIPNNCPCSNWHPKRVLLTAIPHLSIAPCAEYLHKGLSPSYGIMMLMGIITIGAKEEGGLKYKDILSGFRSVAIHA